MTRRSFLSLAVLILLIAAALRLWRLHIYPPGPHYDEAVYLQITRSIAFGGARPFPIVEAYQGREVLYMYLDAPLLALLGDSIFTMRVSSAFYNLITVAASLALGRAMFTGRRGAAVGLAVGVMMALSFPQIMLARQSFRAVTLPLCQALTLLCLWRGLNGARRRWLWLIAGGFFGGLTLYTYMASRLFPLWLLIGGVALLIFERDLNRLKQGVLFFGVLALVAAPMAVYALQKPGIFLGRLEEVTQESQSVTLGESMMLHARMFFLKGDPYLRYNVPGRPYFTWLEGGLLLIGAGVAARRLTHRGRPTERAAYLLALLAPLMALPSLISVGGLPPNHMRSGGMIPLIFVLVAVGFEWVFERMTNLARVPVERALTALTCVSLLVGGVLVGQTYFVWAGRADLFYETDADLAAAATWLKTNADDNTVIYIASKELGEHPTVMIAHPPPVRWLGGDLLFSPPPGMNGLYIYPRSSPPPSEWADWLEPYRLTDLPLAPDGRTAFEAFRVPAGVSLAHSASDNHVGNVALRFEGARLPNIPAGERGRIVMDWTVTQPPPFDDFSPLVQLEDQHGNVLDRATPYLVQTGRWLPGEHFSQRVTVRVPDATPPGHYPVRVTWIGRASDTYMPFADERGAFSGVWATIGMLEVTRPTTFPDPATLDIAVRQPAGIAPGVCLLGWNPPPTRARPGEALPLALFWQATPVNERRQPIKLSAVLVDEQGGKTSLWSGVPLDDYPLNQWADGEVVAERARWQIPREQPAGRYMLALDGGDVAVTLGAVEIVGLPRLFDPPPVGHRLNARFGDLFRLEGYTLKAEMDRLHFSLIWYENTTTSIDFTIFIHIIDVNGVIIAQRDVMPQDNGYPTSLWMPGEWVIDDHILSGLPPGRYSARVGMYVQSTGGRLPVFDASGAALGDFIQIDDVAVGG